MLLLVCFLLASTLPNGVLSDGSLVINWELESPSEPSDIRCPLMACTPERCASGGSFNVGDNFSKLRACDCHTGCYTFGTCCDNYEEVCSPQIVENDRIGSGKRRSNLNVVSCEPMHFRSGMAILYQLMVTQCLRPFLDGVSTPEASLCEVLGKDRLDQYIHVIHGSLVYRNIHCLRCNGVDFADAEVVPVSFVCDIVNVPKPIDKLADLSESGMIELMANESCKLSYEVNNLSPDHNCYTDFFDKCDSVFDILSEYDEVSVACRSYSSYVAIYDDYGLSESYKNPHCALCNTAGHSDPSCIDKNETSLRSYTMSSRAPYTQTFSLLLDFKGRIVSRFTVLKKCRDETNSGSFIDIETNQCLMKLCPRGFKRLNRTMCIEEEGYSFRTLYPEQSFGMRDTYPVNLLIYYENKVGLEYIRQEIIGFLSEWVSFVGLDSIHDCAVSELPSPFCAEISFTFEDYIPDLFFLTSNRFHGIFDTLDEDLSIIHAEISLPASNNNSREGLFYTYDFVFTTDDTDELLLTVTEDDVKNGRLQSLSIYLPEFDSNLQLQQLNFDIRISKSDGRWYVEKKVGVDIEMHSNCSLAACLPLSLPSESNLENFKLEAVLTKYCNIISVIALILSLILRFLDLNVTFPIVIQICIQICLFFAHLIFLLSSSLPFPHTLCVVSASLQHFFWIASFAFMNILSQILYKTFKSLSSHVDQSCSAKIAYLGFGFGIPLLIACVCCVLHFLGYFTYAENGVCWIRGQLNLILAFGVPVGALIVANIVLFSLTAFRLKEATTAVSANAATSVCSFRFRFHLHLRLFSIMGCTWIFGYLTNIKKLEVLSYIFDSLASLNGLFVSLAFSLTRANVRIISERFSSIFTKSRPNSLADNRNTN